MWKAFEAQSVGIPTRFSPPQSLFRTLLLSENVDLPPLKFVPEKNSFLKRKQVTSAQLLCV